MWHGQCTPVMSGPAVAGIKTKLCPVCQKLGKSNKLKLYQINLTEAVLLCTGDKCTYPMGVEPSQNIIFSRDAASVTFGKKPKAIASCTGPSKETCLDISLALASGQRRVAEAVAMRAQSKAGSIEKDVGFQQPGVTKKSLMTRSTNTPGRSKNFESYVSKHASSLGGQKAKFTANEPRSVAAVPAETPGQATNKEASLPDERSSAAYPSNVYPQWTSPTGHPCLSAILSLLVHSIHLQQKAKLNHVQSCLLTLIQTYDAAKAMCRQSASRRNGEKQSMIERARTVLDNTHLQMNERLKLSKQTEGSALCTSLQAIFDDEPAVIRNTIVTRATVHRSCAKCRNQSSENLSSSVLKLSKLPKDLTTSWSDYYSVCDNCKHPMQAKIQINKYPPTFFSYFEHGLPKCSLRDLDFHTTNSDLYKVRGLIVKGEDTMQMTTWIRDVQSSLWMKCDSKMDFLCAFCVQDPLFDSRRVTLVMWEVDNIQTSSRKACETQKDTTGESLLLQQSSNSPTQKKNRSGVDSDLDAGGSWLANVSLLSSSSCISATQGGQSMLTDTEHLAEFIHVGSNLLVTQAPDRSLNTFSDTTTTGNKPVELKQTRSKKSLYFSAGANENGSSEPKIERIRNTKGSIQAKSRSAEVGRMRERFLKDRKKDEKKKEANGTTKSGQDSRLTNKEVATHYHDNGKSSCLMWSSVANGSQANLPKTNDASDSVDKRQSCNSKSANPLLDRVLKYLPKNVVPSLPLIDIVKTPVTEKSKRKSGTCFEGYVPKYVMKHDKAQPESKTTAPREKDTSKVQVTNRSVSQQCASNRKSMHHCLQTHSNSARLVLSVSSNLSGATCTSVMSSVRKRLMQNPEALVSPPSKKRRLGNTGNAPANTGKQEVRNQLNHNSQGPDTVQGRSGHSSEHLLNSLPSLAPSPELLTPVHTGDSFYSESLLLMNTEPDSGQKHAGLYNSAVLPSLPLAVESDNRNGYFPIGTNTQSTYSQPSSGHQHLNNCGPVSSPLRERPSYNITSPNHLTDGPLVVSPGGTQSNRSEALFFLTQSDGNQAVSQLLKGSWKCPCPSHTDAVLVCGPDGLLL